MGYMSIFPYKKILILRRKFEDVVIDTCLGMGTVHETNCLLHFAVICLTGLMFEDSHLVISFHCYKLSSLLYLKFLFFSFFLSFFLLLLLFDYFVIFCMKSFFFFFLI